MGSTLTVAAFLFFVIYITEQHEKPCIPRSYGLNSIVCVCNSTYCDNVLPPQPLPRGQYVSYTSSLSGLRFKKKQGNFQIISESYKNHTVISIDSSERYQNVFGFGGALTDATGINIESLNSGAAENLVRSYFSEEGLEYNLCRVPIGGTDFSTHGYSYNDGDEDPQLNNFKLAFEDYQYKIPLIKAARNLTNNKLELFASAWTAPKWMKHNGKYTGPDFLKTSMYQPWANYFIKFLKGYKKEGVEFWGITTGNEPLTGFLPVKLNSVGWFPCQMRKWIAENLGPTIRNSEFSHLKIIGIDDQTFFYPWYIDEIFKDDRVKNYLDGFGLHWYANGIVSYGRLTKTHNKYPHKFILSTEACEGFLPTTQHVRLGEWKRAESYAKDIIRDMNNWVTGWIDWNMALDVTGGPTYIDNNVDSPIIVNRTAGEFYKQPMYYALGHFSKFVPKGSQRICVKELKEVDLVAFIRPDNATVVVAVNKNNHDINVRIENEDNAAEILDVLPARSINTFLYW